VIFQTFTELKKMKVLMNLYRVLPRRVLFHLCKSTFPLVSFQSVSGVSITRRNFYSNNENEDPAQVAKYHDLVDHELESLSDMTNPLESALDDDLDINLSMGVLSINLGPAFQNKTWVINKQTPNRQIWWSSPISGPRRFEYNDKKDKWTFTRDENVELREELRKELEKITKIKLK
jgi:frataxin